MTVRLRKARSGVAESRLRQFESRMGSLLPQDFRSFLLSHDGGEPDDNEFDVPEHGNDSSVNEFLGVDQIEEELERYAGRLPAKAIPIGLAEGGNLVLLASETGHVLFWDHELEDANPVATLADSFSTFWRALEPFDPSTVELEPGQVKRAWIDPDLLK